MVETHPLSREMDIDRPCAARIYDAFLGGCHNFGVEREFVERAESALPGITGSFRANRGFLRRIVEHVVAQGVRQFLDLGSGIPTIGHVHEIAARKTDDFRVVYVDNEPLIVAHSKPLLADEPRADIVQADCREPEAVRSAVAATGLFDPNRPVGLLMSAVLHFVPDRDNPRELVAAYRDELVPGSYLAVSHLTGTVHPAELTTLEQLYAETSDPLAGRPHSWIDSLFTGLTKVPPGAVPVDDWRPERQRSQVEQPLQLLYGGLARKPFCQDAQPGLDDR